MEKINPYGFTDIISRLVQIRLTCTVFPVIAEKSCFVLSQFVLEIEFEYILIILLDDCSSKLPSKTFAIITFAIFFPFKCLNCNHPTTGCLNKSLNDFQGSI